MDKRLLEQVQRALQAQEDTIQRQQQMLDDKDIYIAELTDSLTKLALAQTQETKRLPILMQQLQDKIDEQVSVQSGWLKHRQTYMNSIKQLVEESVKLCNVQIQLVQSMSEYQSAIVQQNNLDSATTKLQSKLKDYLIIQNNLEQSQTKITDSQSVIQMELLELNKLLSKHDKQ